MKLTLIRKHIGLYLLIFITILILSSTAFLPPKKEVPDLLEYDINLNGKKVGYLNLHRKLVNGNFLYSFDSKVDYTLLKRIDVIFNIQSYFKEGYLIESYSSYKINGTTKSNCEVKKESKDYKALVNGTEHRVSINFIKYSFTTLYFHEPVNIQKVFSERYAKFLPIKKIGDQHYLITMPDGGKNYYKFSDGICHEVNTGIAPFGKLQFKLKTNIN